MLLTLDRPAAALEELSQLAQLSPGEPSVQVHMARAHKRLGQLDLAQACLEVRGRRPSSLIKLGGVWGEAEVDLNP